MANPLGQLRRVESDIRKVERISKRTKNLVPGKGSNGNVKDAEKLPLEEDVGRKAESVFVTSFVSRKGDEGINCDYFGYIELSDAACWVIADGFDEDGFGNEAAKIVSESIIDEFVSKPTFSRKFLNKIILKARKKLEEIKLKSRKKRGMSASVVVFLTDYTSCIIGNVGNARAYLIRDDIVKYKTRDNSISHLMYEMQQLDYKEIRFHSQRNRLTQSIGDVEKIEVELSKEMYLYDGDRLLLMSHGAWEHLDESEIEVELSKSETVGKWLGKLENKVKGNCDGKLPNYTMAGIFINQVVEPNTSGKKRNYAKIICITMIVLGILMILFTLYMYKRGRNIRYEQAFAYEELAFKEVENGNLQEAVKQLKNSKNEYENLKLTKSNSNFIERAIFSAKVANTHLGNQVDSVDEKIIHVNKLQEALEMIKDGDKGFNANDFFAAETSYSQARNGMMEVRGINYERYKEIIDQLEEKIIVSSALKLGYRQKLDADEQAQNGEIEDAIRNYLGAKIIFLKHGKIDLMTEVTEKSDILARTRDRKFNEAFLYERQSYEVEATDIASAIIYMEMARSMYGELRDNERITGAENRIANLEEMRRSINDESREYLRQATTYAQSGEYERALESVRRSKDISTQLNDMQKMVDSLQKEGDILAEGDRFQLAKEKYEEAFALSVDTNNTIQQDYLQGKVKAMEKVIAGNKIEEEGDALFSDKKHKDARRIFKEAISKYEELKDDNYFDRGKYNKIMEVINEKERQAWKKSNWIPFF